jgi:GNAT superfamily N-acetyltransferase
MGTDTADPITRGTDDDGPGDGFGAGRDAGDHRGPSRDQGLSRDLSVPDTVAQRAEIAAYLDAVARRAGHPFTWDSTRWDVWCGADALARRLDDPGYLGRAVRVWRDSEHEIVAVALHDRTGGSFDVVVDPARRDTAEAVIADALRAWGDGDGDGARTQAVVDDVHEDALRRLGFRPLDAGLGVIHEFSTTTLRRVVLPPGYTVRDMRHTGDRRARLVCMAQAFQGEDRVAKDAAYPRADLPGYRGELDLAVIAPHGLAVATCFGYVPGGGAPAVIEGVGTRPGSRGLGLATAAVSRCLNLLADRGEHRATATGWSPEANALYRHLRPTRTRVIDGWVLESA